MTIHLYRSPFVEHLVEDLARALDRTRPADPLDEQPIVVGSRGMERHLRHALATQLGIVSQVRFLFPGNAFGTALEAIEGRRNRIAWIEKGQADDPWRGQALVFGVLKQLRELAATTEFAAVRGYLGNGAGGAREMRFARDVAACIERMLYDRPEESEAFIEKPAGCEQQYGWLARLMRTLADEGGASPAQRLARVMKLAPSNRPEAMHLFGLSTMRPGDKRRLVALARHMDLHLYVLAPSHVFLDEMRSPASRGRELRRAAPDDVARILDEVEGRNGLLASNAGPSRELQEWLEGLQTDERHRPHRPVRRPPSLLTALQDWVGTGGDNPSSEPSSEEHAWNEALLAEPHLEKGIASIEVHRSHGALRQCEVLRDALMRRFLVDPTLEPRHILVMTPDLATYAPLIAMVMGRHPPIPTQVQDLGLRATNPLAEVLLRLLSLTDERLDAPTLLDLVAMRPVQARFGLSSEEVARLRDEVRDANLRWGWDADERAAHDQPTLHANTVRFGLERLALGVLMAPEAQPGLDDSTGGEPVGPLALHDAEGLRRRGRFARFCRTLQEARNGLRRPRGIGEWRRDLAGLIDALTLAEGDDAWMKARFMERLSEALLPSGLPAGAPELPLDVGALRELLSTAFDQPLRGPSGTGGAVQVTGLEPLRSVPFRVIALVGMDDGSFPRTAQIPTWNPFHEGRPGEHARSVVDRHLYLEALLCARDALLLLGAGFEERRNASVPMSLVVEELVQLLERGLPRPTLESAGVVRSHALQPWSHASFEALGTASLDAAWQTGAEALRRSGTAAERGQPDITRGGVGLASSRFDAPWPPERTGPEPLEAGRMVRALVRPQRELLEGRLRLRLGSDDESLPRREPIETAELASWRLRRRILDGFLDGDLCPDSSADRSRLMARLRGEGVLPIRAGGERDLARHWEEAAAVLENARAAGTPSAERNLLTASGASRLVHVRPERIHVDAAGRKTAVVLGLGTEPRDEELMLALVTLLVSRTGACEGRIDRALCVGHEKSQALVLPETLDASMMLGTYVDTYQRVRSGPVLLFPELSSELARQLRRHPESPREALEASLPKWSGGPQRRGASDDPAVAALLRHRTPTDLLDRADDLAHEAQTVWSPVLNAIDAAKTSRSREDA